MGKFINVVANAARMQFRSCDTQGGGAHSRVNVLDILGLKRGTANQEGIENDADRPSIDFKAVSVCCVKQHLRGNVIGRATNSLLPLTRVLNECSETKVADFDVHVGVEE